MKSEPNIDQLSSEVERLACQALLAARAVNILSR